MSGPRWTGRLPRMAGLAIVGMLTLVGCTAEPDIPSGLGDPVTQGDGLCGLLTSNEIEVALNTSLDGEPVGGKLDELAASRDGDADDDDEEGADSETDPDPSETAEMAGPDADEGTDEVEVVELRDYIDPGFWPDPPADDPSARGAWGRPMLPDMVMCEASADEARVAWGVLTEDAEARFGRYRDWHADYVEEVAIADYDAVWDPGLRTVVVLADDAAVGLWLTAPNPPVGDDQDPTDYFEQQALELAERMVDRMERLEVGQ